MRVAVVGAGLAGLSAAGQLVGAGHEVVVLEARDRVGGRVHSCRLDDGAVIEMGAEFILPTNTYIRELARSLGLELWDKGIRYGRREPRGGLALHEAELEAALSAVADAIARDPAAGARACTELLASLEIDFAAREYILARAEISAASPAELIPAADLQGVAHIGDEPSPSIAGGNQRLALALAERLGPAVRLGSPVRRITDGGEGVTIATDGGELHADRVVVAVPAMVLDRIRFDPPLPESKREALDELTVGQAAKLFVQLGHVPERRAVMSVPERYWSWTASGGGQQAQAVVSAFAGSPAALERLGVERGAAHWLRSLAALRPELGLDPDDASSAILSTWADEEWTGGAYSVSPGPGLTTILHEPLGRISFAGEYLAGEFSGLMEGALRSGRDAAHELIAIAAGR